MPYIPEKDRDLKKEIDFIALNCNNDDAKLVWALTRLAHTFVLINSSYPPGWKDKRRAKNALDDAKDEYLNAVMNRHETNKRKLNGPVSELDI